MSIFKKTQEELISGTIKNNLKKYNNPNIRANAMKPVTCDYYTSSVRNLTAYKGTNTVEAVIGEDSPLRYYKIKNLPIIISSEISGDSDEEVDILDTNMQLFTFPKLVIPKENDLIEFSHMKGTIFKIKDGTVKIAQVMNNPYHSIEVEAFTTNANTDYFELPKQIIKSFTCRTAFNGKDSTILSDDTVDKIDKAISMVEDIIDEYNAVFLDTNTISYTYYTGTEYHYCRYLTEFIRRGSLHYVNSRNNIYVSEEVPTERSFDINYKRSLFEKVMNKKTLKDTDFIVKYSSLDRVIWSRLTNLNGTVYVSTKDKNIPVFKEEVINYVEGDLVDDAIRKYVAGEDIDIFDYEDYEIEETHDNYIKIPILISILKKEIEKLQVTVSDIEDKILY